MKIAYQVNFSEKAYQNLNSALKWYENEQIGLGKRFYKAVGKVIGTISETPFIYAIRYKGIRYAIVKKFPFSVFYIVDEAQQVIEIVAILHNARNPEIWEELL